MLRDSIKQLVAENRTEEVIEALLKLSDKIKDQEIKNSIVILSSRYKRFVDQTIRGIADVGDQNTFLAQLNDAALKLIDDIPESYFAESSRKKAQPAAANKFDRAISRAIPLAVMVLLLFSLLALVGSMGYYMYYYLTGPGKKEDVDFGNLPLLWISLTGFAASAFFYFANRIVK